jgi:hypothetical protein
MVIVDPPLEEDPAVVVPLVELACLDELHAEATTTRAAARVQAAFFFVNMDMLPLFVPTGRFLSEFPQTISHRFAGLGSARRAGLRPS